jgi:hypothetical protein
MILKVISSSQDVNSKPKRSFQTGKVLCNGIFLLPIRLQTSILMPILVCIHIRFNAFKNNELQNTLQSVYPCYLKKDRLKSCRRQKTPNRTSVNCLESVLKTVFKKIGFMTKGSGYGC